MIQEKKDDLIVTERQMNQETRRTSKNKISYDNHMIQEKQII